MKFSGFLSGKVKVRPEDFIVNEKINLSVKNVHPNNGTGNGFYLYRLKKRDWNTSDILIRIAKENKIRLKEIQYGGRKDRYASTTQYLTSKQFLTLPKEYHNKIELELLGITEQPMSPASIVENEFIITLRSLQEKEFPQLYKNIEFVKTYGFINYFDSQRFSTFKQDMGIPAFHLLNQDYEHFIKFYLIQTLNTESKQAKDRKYAIEKSWGNWQICYNMAKTKLEKTIFKYLLKNSSQKDVFKKCIRFLPKEELRFMISILQGFIWNICVSLFLRANLPSMDLAYFKTRIGPLVFLKNHNKIPLSEFPLLHPSVIKDQRYSEYFKNVLNHIKNHYLYGNKKLHVNINLYNQKLAKNHRKIEVIPKNFEILSIEDDDIYKNKKLMKIKFSLESGSYATMLLKRLLIRI